MEIASALKNHRIISAGGGLSEATGSSLCSEKDWGYLELFVTLWKENPCKSRVIAEVLRVRKCGKGYENPPTPLLLQQVVIAKYIHCSQTNDLVFPSNFDS